MPCQRGTKMDRWLLMNGCMLAGTIHINSLYGSNLSGMIKHIVAGYCLVYLNCQTDVHRSIFITLGTCQQKPSLCYLLGIRLANSSDCPLVFLACATTGVLPKAVAGHARHRPSATATLLIGKVLEGGAGTKSLPLVV